MNFPKKSMYAKAIFAVFASLTTKTVTAPNLAKIAKCWPKRRPEWPKMTKNVIFAKNACFHLFLYTVATVLEGFFRPVQKVKKTLFEK